MVASLALLASVIRVDAAGPVRTLHEAMALARVGDTIVVAPGEYRSSATLLVDRRVTVIARAGAVLHGAGPHTLIHVTADSVTIRGLTLRGVAPSSTEDRSAIRVDSAMGCRLLDNVVEDAFFGIYLAATADCEVAGNRVTGSGRGEQRNGNAIHLWSSTRLTITDNVVEAYRDGIYMEFVTASRLERNTSRRNRRYGLHFMFSNDCAYVGNTFRENGAGVAVMYTRRVEMRGNRFLRNLGPAAYGLLLKDISESAIAGNTFHGNSTALHMDGANGVTVQDNRFESNGWGVRLLANSVKTRIAGNTFVRNAFDLATNSRSTGAELAGNFWDSYRGYDLDGDGAGDVPHRPVRLFALVVEQHQTALVLQGSFLITLLDMAERAFPLLTPGTLADDGPRMREAP